MRIYVYQFEFYILTSPNFALTIAYLPEQSTRAKHDKVEH